MVIAASSVVGLGWGEGGCSGQRSQTVRVIPESGAVDLTEAPVLSAPGRGGRGVEAGLEVSWMVATADRRTVATSLLPYVDQPLPCSPERADTWAVNGLRIVRVPLGDWPSLSAKLRLSGASQRQWINQTSGWVEIVRGPDKPDGQTIALDAERLDLGPGRLRLLARCWPAPVVPVSEGAGIGARLTIELLPQHVESQTRAWKRLTMTEAPSGPPDKLEAGLVFSRLLLELSAHGTAGPSVGAEASGREAGTGVEFVYVLIPERPGVNWSDYVTERPESSEPATSDAAPRVGEVVRHGRSGSGPASSAGSRSSGAGITDAGPIVPAVPTLGEALFGAERDRVFADGRSEQTREPAARALVVLVPRVPASFQLMPPITSGDPR